MRILLTNDDGINAPGIALLRELALELSDDVWTVAPETDQSGLGHALSLSHPLRARKVAEKQYAVSGTPTDCVIMGVRHLIDGPVDLVLSGINAGQNVGDHVTYSGTVAGAMEGAFLGIRSIALSQAFAFDGHRDVPWDTVRAHAPGVLKDLLKVDFPRSTLLNVNFPACRPEEVQGAAHVRQGTFEHGLGIEERHDGRGLSYYWLKFQGNIPELEEGTDMAALAERQIAITPIRMDLTDHLFLDRLKAGAS
jgi:5'-nucleotidase